jgi:uncharacterized protein (TIGR02421 family)
MAWASNAMMAPRKKEEGEPEKSTTKSFPELTRAVVARLRNEKRVRRTLPGWGRVHIDRPVPFICAYRRTPESEPLDMQNFVTSEAAYLYTEADKQQQADVHKLVSEIAEEMVEQFGAFLVLEIWAAPLGAETGDDNPRTLSRPRFRIVAQRDLQLDDFLDRFVEVLTRIKLDGQTSRVDVASRARVAPPNQSPLLSAAEAQQKNCLVVGLEISPVFADLKSGKTYPQVRRNLDHQLTIALKQIFFRFARTRTTHRPPHYHALGRRATVKAVWRADRMLAQVSDTFDFLLQVSPINGTAAWRDFEESGFQTPPTFRYRPLPIDPLLLKRELYKTPIESVEDPAIGQLFRDKLLELDRQISMLLDVNTPQFVHGSIQLYGGVDDALFATAETMLERFPVGRKNQSAGSVDARAFAARAMKEIAYLRRQDANVRAKAVVRDDVSGLIVSRGSLLVGAETSITRDRVDALIQHEIGTHVLTYYNGRAQPFRQLSSGLSGYEALQEGIAVLAEFLVGGLNSGRLRLLAARVVVVRMMIEGATFVECFQRLVDQYSFIPHTAFIIVMRVFRGGGLTKDAIYLRGLVMTLKYLGQGGDLEPLFLGKISVEHISMMKELRWRQVLTEPKLKPRYMTDPAALARLERVRRGMNVLDLLEQGRVSARSTNRR